MALAVALCWLFTFAGAAPAAAQIDIQIVNPAYLASTDPADVFAYVTSPSELTSVQAAVGTRTATLTRVSGNGWWGAISLVGLPIGQKQLVVSATMYWGTTGSGWREAHNSFGVPETGTKWALAEGRTGGPRGYQTVVLVSQHVRRRGRSAGHVREGRRHDRGAHA